MMTKSVLKILLLCGLLLAALLRNPKILPARQTS